jgi:hypothetical protein
VIAQRKTPETSPGWDSWNDHPFAIPNNQGYFEIGRLSPVEYTLFVREPGRRAYPVDHPPVQAGTRGIEIVIASGKSTRISGRVVTATGKGLTNFIINGESYEEESGRFELMLEDVEEPALYIWANDFAPARVAVTSSVDGFIDLGQIVLNSGRTVRARVEHKLEGAVLERTNVFLQPTDKPLLGMFTKAHLGPDGTATFSTLGNVPYKVLIGERSYDSQLLGYIDETATEVTFKLP